MKGVRMRDLLEVNSKFTVIIILTRESDEDDFSVSIVDVDSKKLNKLINPNAGWSERGTADEMQEVLIQTGKTF